MTLLSDLPVGSKIKFGKYQIGTETPEVITWIKGDNNHYKENAVPLISEYIIDYGLEFDAKEINNPDLGEKIDGNNTYKYSNIDQWLNTNKQSNWFTKAHDYDEPPSYINKPGFLYNFSQYEQSLVEDVPIKTTLSYSEDSGTFQYEDIIRKIFLLSVNEYGFTSSTKPEEGTMFEDLFALEDSIICEFSPQLTAYLTENNITGYPIYWTRTPDKYNSLVHSFYIDPSEHCYSFYSSQNAVGVRPALNLKSIVEVSDSPDTDGYYTVNTPIPKTLQSFKKLALQEEVNILTNKVNSLELSSGSGGGGGNADILTTIMILQNEQPGQVVGLGIYLDCLTDQSTFTITNGFYDSTKKLVYVG